MGVWGTPAQVTEQLKPFTDLGVEYFMMRFVDFPSTKGAELFAERVIPNCSRSARSSSNARATGPRAFPTTGGTASTSRWASANRAFSGIDKHSLSEIHYAGIYKSQQQENSYA